MVPVNYEKKGFLDEEIQKAKFSRQNWEIDAPQGKNVLGNVISPKGRSEASVLDRLRAWLDASHEAMTCPSSKEM